MQTDTDGGMISRQGWEILHDWNQGIVHAVSPCTETMDPEYTV